MSAWWEIVEKFNPEPIAIAPVPEQVIAPIPAEPEVAPVEPTFLPVPCTCSEKPFPHFQYCDGTGPGTCDRQRREKALDPLWGDPCSCGGRDWQRKGPTPNLECLSCGRVVRSEYLAKGGKR